MPRAFSCLERSKKPTSSATISTTIQGLRTDSGSEAYLLDGALPRFGPIYREDNDAIQEAKRLALTHILNDDENLRQNYIRSIVTIQPDIIRSYNFEGLRPGTEFQEKIVNDGCFFLLVALYILGGGEHLRFPDEHPYFGENRDLADWIPALFFVGNQIPYIVVQALMKQDFFQRVILGGTWRQPPQDPLKLALYRTVVEPELNRPAQLMQPPPSDIVQALHSLLLGPGNNDPAYSEKKDFPDLEAGRDDVMRFPSAGELEKSGIYLRRSNKGINSIRFRNLVICACLYVPPLSIDRNTKHMIRCVTSHEQNLPESDREVTAYLQLMRNLAATYKDFKILEKSGIIEMKEKDFKCEVMITLDNLVSSHRKTLTLNFRDIRRKLEDYKKPPWEVIAFVFGVFSMISAVMAIVSYAKPRK